MKLNFMQEDTEDIFSSLAFIRKETKSFPYDPCICEEDTKSTISIKCVFLKEDTKSTICIIFVNTKEETKRALF